MKFVVLGAGLSGLSCGIGLLEAGHGVTIMEKEDTVGGLCRSYRKNGFTFDYGPHFLFGPKIRELLCDRLAPSLSIPLIRRTGERMYIHNRLFEFPFEPKNMLKRMEKGLFLPAAKGFMEAQLFKKRRYSANLEEWIVNAVGKPLYDYIDLSGYVKKLYGLTPEAVASEWGQQKLKFLSRWRDENLASLGIQALKENRRLRKKTVSYPPSGIDFIPNALAERFVQLGGLIKVSAPSVSVVERRNRVEITSSNNEVFHCDYLVSSIPLSSFVRTLAPKVPKATLQFLSNLKQRKTDFVLLYFDTPKVMDYQCLYFTEPRFLFRRVTEFKRLSPRMAPDGRSSLCVEVTSDHEQEPQMGAETVQTILKQLHTTGKVDVKGYSHHEFLVVPNTYPIYESGYSESLKKVVEQLSSYKRVISFGRQGLFFYNTMSNSIIDGYTLGQKLSNDLAFSSAKEDCYARRASSFDPK